MEQESGQGDAKREDNLPLTNLEPIVRQLEDLIRFTMECEKKEPVPDISFEVIGKQITELRKLVNTLNSAYINTLQNLSITPDEVKRFQEDIEKQGGPEKKILMTLKRLEKQCEEERERIHQSLVRSEETSTQVKKEIRETKKPTPVIGKQKPISRKSRWMKT